MTRLLVVDTETGSLHPPKVVGASGVAEVAYIEIDEECRVLAEWSSMVNPGVPMQAGASAVNGIYDDDVKDAPLLERVYQIDEPVVHIGHNSAFDLKFVGHCYSNLVGTLCTLSLARTYIRTSENHKLGTLADHLGIEKGEAHRALGDCRTTLGLLRILVDRTGRSLTDLIAAARVPSLTHTMPFGLHKGKLVADLPISYIRWFDDREVDANLRKSFDLQLKLRA